MTFELKEFWDSTGFTRELRQKGNFLSFVICGLETGLVFWRMDLASALLFTQASWFLMILIVRGHIFLGLVTRKAMGSLRLGGTRCRSKVWHLLTCHLSQGHFNLFMFPIFPNRDNSCLPTGRGSTHLQPQHYRGRGRRCISLRSNWATKWVQGHSRMDCEMLGQKKTETKQTNCLSVKWWLKEMVTK